MRQRLDRRIARSTKARTITPAAGRRKPVLKAAAAKQSQDPKPRKPAKAGFFAFAEHFRKRWCGHRLLTVPSNARLPRTTQSGTAPSSVDGAVRPVNYEAWLKAAVLTLRIDELEPFPTCQKRPLDPTTENSSVHIRLSRPDKRSSGQQREVGIGVFFIRID